MGQIKEHVLLRKHRHNLPPLKDINIELKETEEAQHNESKERLIKEVEAARRIHRFGMNLARIP
jgi:hypothetical protein